MSINDTNEFFFKVILNYLEEVVKVEVVDAELDEEMLKAKQAITLVQHIVSFSYKAISSLNLNNRQYSFVVYCLKSINISQV